MTKVCNWPPGVYWMSPALNKFCLIEMLKRMEKIQNCLTGIRGTYMYIYRIWIAHHTDHFRGYLKRWIHAESRISDIDFAPLCSLRKTNELAPRRTKFSQKTVAPPLEHSKQIGCTPQDMCNLLILCNYLWNHTPRKHGYLSEICPQTKLVPATTKDIFSFSQQTTPISN